MTDSNMVLVNAEVAAGGSSLQDTTRATIGSIARSLVADDNIWAEFLKLQISEHTKRTYTTLAGFYNLLLKHRLDSLFVLVSIAWAY